MRRFATVLTAAALGFVSLVACESHPRNGLIVTFDAGSDASTAGDAEAGSSYDAPAEADPTLGAPCLDDAQCGDGIACTYDTCDPLLRRCRNVPDDTQCDDGIYCDGREACAIGHGCEPGPVVTCEDGNSCTIDRCVESTKSCVHAPRDVDGDGDPDAHCTGGHDCDDLDPNVSSLHAEVCANGKDDNCNGQIDETPCVQPVGDICSSAVMANGAGSYALSTAGCNKDYATSCSVTNPQAGQDVVAAIVVPSGPNVDLEVWALSRSGIEVAVAIDGACGQPTSELACGSGAGASSVRARARNVPPGTYYAVVTTQSASAVELQVDLLAPTPKAANVDCATAAPMQPGMPTTVSIVDPPTDLPSACPAVTGELTYALTLTQSQDVRVYASTVRGSGSPIIGLRSPRCSGAADELRCATAGSAPLFARNLQPATYVITVGATSPVDVSVDVSLSLPSTPPPDQTCSGPPSITANQTLSVDLSNHEAAIADGCFSGGPHAAYDLLLASASDVLLIDRFPQSESGGISLDGPACTASTVLACDQTSTPARVGKRNVPAGDYRVVVADSLGLQSSVEALVRPTIAPTMVPPHGADTCAQALDVGSGGFFTGDTSTAAADYSSGCDAPSSGGAPDQVLSFELAQPQRVVFDMEGSGYDTILDLREGGSCPGTPIVNDCYVGFSAERSFLDVELQPGHYWVIIGGYSQQKGPWDLDMRVLLP